MEQTVTLSQNKERLVSVVVPAYNTEKYIEKCLISLQKQDYKNYEVIILDDGSDDGTGKICNKFVETDKRFRLIPKKNSGVSDTRNIGIDMANGTYIIFVDSDDYMTEDYIKTLVESLENNRVQLACADYFNVKDESVEVHGKNTRITEIMSARNAIGLLSDKSEFQGYLWNKIFVKEILKNNNLYFDKEIKIWEDMLFCLKYLTCIDKVAYIKKPIYYYVQRKKSAMNDTAVWNEYTHQKALDKMWMLVQPYAGNFKEYIRNYYANDLVGMLGKKVCYNRQDCKKAIAKVDELDGNLSLKHKIKLMIFRRFPMVTQFFPAN